MQKTKIDLRDTHSFSQFFLDYLQEKPELKPFYGLAPKIENFEKQIANKEFDQAKRDTLCQALNAQYEPVEAKPAAQKNIDLLAKPNTFTITTGHQLNIFTGPLYFLYKIITVINAAKELSKKHPEYNFVPVYWMATEDHDFDEISFFNLFGKKYRWECEEKGGVGRYSTAGVRELLKELPESVELFEKAYEKHENLADAVRCYVNDLFGEYGVVVVDGDSHELKAEFAAVIEDDLIANSAHGKVGEANAALEELGYKTQIFPREINFFYLDHGVRERITKEGSKFKVLNTNLTFSESEIKDLIQRSPEKFSPNVVMRPLYQETILPNLAYIGGPAEIIYWLQLGKVFENYKTPFPILFPRNFALYINGGNQKKLDKFELTDEDLFKSGDDWQAEYLARHGQDEMNLNGEVNDLQKVFDHLIEKAEVVDSSLKGFIGAEHAKAVKSLENIEKRLKKSEERKHETALNQLAAIKEKLFPGGGLQERHDNFLNFYINNPNFVEGLVQNLDAFDLKMHVLRG